MSDAQGRPPRIDFPCQDYPIKVIGDAGEGFATLVLEVVRRHAPDLDEASLSLRDSRNGRYLSVQLRITATGAEQLQAINADLKETGRVRMVL